VSWSDSGARTGPHEIGLIAKIAARSDDDAARRLYRKYRLELLRFGVHVLHDQGQAEEMVQETFIKFCQRARSYDASRGPVRGWLFTMACSAAIDIARRPSSRPFLPVEDFQLPPPIRQRRPGPPQAAIDLRQRDAPGPRQLHPFRDRRAPRHPDRHRQIPDG
jgi:RNA polymerase sigma factor (sigma-70 family)